nr:PREDICTED: long-chain-fatty-acid--CoA ligase ACSBG1 [Lepisosteus oculatus]
MSCGSETIQTPDCNENLHGSTEKIGNSLLLAIEGFMINPDAQQPTDCERERDKLEMEDESCKEKKRAEEVLATVSLAPAEALWTTEAGGAVKLRIDDSCPQRPITVHQMFMSSVQKYGSLYALATKTKDKWEKITFSEYYKLCRAAARSFLKDTSVLDVDDVAIPFKCPQLSVVYTALQCWVVSLSFQIWGRLPHLKAVVQYVGPLQRKLPNLYLWDEFMELGSEISEEHLDDIISNQRPNQCCVLIYTSGTTGKPKGVMLSHDNITWTAQHASRVGDMQPAEKKQEILVSYLPLSHIAAQIYDLWTGIQAGELVYFAQPDALKGSLISTLKEACPTSHMGVPRVWEKLMEKIKEGVAQSGFLKKKMLTWAMSVTLEANLNWANKNEAKPFLFTLADSLILEKVRAELGFSHCLKFFSGAAPITGETLEFFLGLNIFLYEAYGMSETTGPHFMSGPRVYRLQSCGKVVPGCKFKLRNKEEEGNGEVCFWGRNVFMGYLHMEDKTKEALDEDGWLCSGDIGKVDKDGFLYITGRIKELLITAGGENIPPVPIEDAVKKELPIISNAMLIGDKRKFLSMLLTLKCVCNPETTEPTDELSLEAVEFCQQVGSQATKVSDIIGGRDKAVYQAIQEGIERVNKRATSNAQRIQKWTILEKDFSIPGGELGPTMKLRRPCVLEMYRNEIGILYKE